MKIAEQFHAIKIPFQIQVAPGKTFDRFVYSYLIYGDEICLIDSGVAHSDSVIFDYIRKSNRSPEEISLMILTHAHPDHIGFDIGVFRYLGLVPMALGVIIYVLCSRNFVFIGKGTPIPFTPTKELIVTGLYRFVRNP